jgi:hypothetical protein
MVWVVVDRNPREMAALVQEQAAQARVLEAVRREREFQLSPRPR